MNKPMLTGKILFALVIVPTAAVFAEIPFFDRELAEVTRLDRLAESTWLAATNDAQVAALQERVRAAAVRAIGRFPERTPLEVRKVGEEKFDGYRVEKLVFASQPGFHVPCHLYLPDSPEFKPPYPALLMPCGHGVEGKSELVHARGPVVAVKAGFAALMCDPIDEGECRQRDGEKMSGVHGHRAAGLRAHLLGENLAMYRIWDGIRAIDLLCERDDIDRDRIGCAGFSGGGTLTSYMNVFDRRIKCASPSAFITSISEIAKGPGPQDSEQIIFGQLGFGLNHFGFLAMRAPNPILPGFSYDDFFPFAGSIATFSSAARWYRLHGWGDRIDHLECPGRHNWYESEKAGLVKWMDRWLNGNESALPFDRYRLGQLNDRLANPPGRDPGLGLGTDPRAMCCHGSVRTLAGERTIYDLLAAKAAKAASVRKPLTPETVRRVAGIREDADGPMRPSTVKCEFAADSDGATVLSVTEAIDYDRGVRKFLFNQNGAAEELAAMMMWRGENLIARRTEDLLAAVRCHLAQTPGKVRLRADRATAIAAAHARYLHPEYFSGIELVDPPPAWKQLFDDPLCPVNATDVVFGAYRHYDWTDLVR